MDVIEAVRIGFVGPKGYDLLWPKGYDLFWPKG